MISDLSQIAERLEEYKIKASYEVDIDIEELDKYIDTINMSEKNMTPQIARVLKKNIDEIVSFLDDQTGMYRKLLSGMMTGKKAIGQYRTPKLKSKSKFVYRRA
jgi:hypothetical protein